MTAAPASGAADLDHGKDPTMTPKPTRAPAGGTPLRLIALGGMGEIGKNCYLYEYGDELLLVDAGLAFPDEATPGVDIIIPDTSYLAGRAHQLRGILITHAHEDHIGALVHLLPELPGVPVYASTLARALIESKLKGAKAGQHALRTLNPGDRLTLGAFTVEPFRIGHSIPDAQGFALHTPVGTVIHTGDFKFDRTPIDGRGTDFELLKRFGADGVLALVSDSTRAESPGHTPSEAVVGETFREVIGSRKGRIIVATFASNIARLQQVISAAEGANRRVAVVGRSMEQNAKIAQGIEYLKLKAPLLAGGDIAAHTGSPLVIATTGAQGEPMAGLAKMGRGEHRNVKIEAGDTVIVSASPIPGNEEAVGRTIDDLFRAGADVIYHSIAKVHVSGHASADELREMVALTRPRHMVPMHGEFRMQVAHGRLAVEAGVDPSRVHIAENGFPIEFHPDGSVRRPKPVAHGRRLIVHGSSHPLDESLLTERLRLAAEGIVVVAIGSNGASPVVLSRGFLDAEQERRLLPGAAAAAAQVLKEPGLSAERRAERVAAVVAGYLARETCRRPQVMPLTVA
jgi:ribonuclease J